MKRFILLFPFFAVVSTTPFFGQKFSAGAGLGASYMFGDLGDSFDTPATKFVASLEQNFIGKKFYEFSVQYNFAKVSGDDQFAAFAGRQIRGMKFESLIHEFTLLNRFKLFSRKKDNTLRKFYSFTAIGLGIFHFNPSADGIKLQPLGTSGQNIPGYNIQPYSLWSISIPFDVGFYVNLNKSAALRFDCSIHWTLTDWIDDVAAVPYADPDLVSQYAPDGFENEAAYYAQPSVQHAALRGNADNDSFLFLKLSWIKKF